MADPEGMSVRTCLVLTPAVSLSPWPNRRLNSCVTEGVNVWWGYTETYWEIHVQGTTSTSKYSISVQVIDIYE